MNYRYNKSLKQAYKHTIGGTLVVLVPEVLGSNGKSVEFMTIIDKLTVHVYYNYRYNVITVMIMTLTQ